MNGPRTRRIHHKVRTGCSTCKRRRIKCDETQPKCLRCTSSGRTCAGYDTPQPWIFESGQDDSNSQLYSKRLGSSHPKTSKTATSIMRTEPGEKLFGLGHWQVLFREPLLSQFMSAWFSQSELDNSQNLPHDALRMSTWALTGVSDLGHCDCRTDAFLFLSLCTAFVKTKNASFKTGAVAAYSNAIKSIQSCIQRWTPETTVDQKSVAMQAIFAFAMGEYILGSWANADHHWGGLEHIVASGGVGMLEDDLALRLANDHAAIWVGCGYLQKHAPMYAKKDYLAALQRIEPPNLLFAVCLEAYKALPVIEEYYSRHRTASAEEMKESITRFQAEARELDLWWQRKRRQDLESLWSTATDFQHDQERGLEIAVASNYKSAFSIHILLGTLDAIQRLVLTNTTDKPLIADTKASLEKHRTEIMHHTDMILNCQSGMDAVDFLMFPVDACWMACEALRETSQLTLAWFSGTSEKMSSRGFPPFRRPWDGASCRSSPSDQEQVVT